jgi:hypothetical protein
MATTGIAPVVLSWELISLLVAAGGAVFAAIAVVVTLSVAGRREIRRKVESGGRRVVRFRAKWLRSPLVAGLTPFAVVYRVTTQVGEEAAKVKLYAYDFGTVRQFSGGVWRDA